MAKVTIDNKGDSPNMKIQYWMAALLVVITSALALGAIEAIDQPDPAAAGHQVCGSTYRYGSPTRTIVRDSNLPYCDVQARLARNTNGTRQYFYSPFRLHEAKVSSWEGVTWYGYDRNCWRTRERPPRVPTTRYGRWQCF